MYEAKIGLGQRHFRAELGGTHRQNRLLLMLVLLLRLVLVTLIIMLGFVLLLRIQVRVLLHDTMQARTRNQPQASETEYFWTTQAHATAASVIPGKTHHRPEFISTCEHMTFTAHLQRRRQPAVCDSVCLRSGGSTHTLAHCGPKHAHCNSEQCWQTTHTARRTSDEGGFSACRVRWLLACGASAATPLPATCVGPSCASTAASSPCNKARTGQVCCRS